MKLNNQTVCFIKEGETLKLEEDMHCDFLIIRGKLDMNGYRVFTDKYCDFGGEDSN